MSTSKFLYLNMYFVVEFLDKEFKNDFKFQSVNGIHARLQNKEGQKLPIAIFEPIVLKRAYQPDSKLIAWSMNAINNKQFTHKNLIIKLLDSNSEFISGWQVTKAIPIAWYIEELHAQEGKILIETIELKYRYFQVLDSKGNIISPIQQH